MKRILIYTVTVLLFMFASCINKQRPNKQELRPEEIVLHNKGTDAEPGLKNADSMQVLYFNDPDADSMRYTRFFRFTTIVDSASLNVIVLNLDKPFTEFSAPKKCRSEGKMYFFGNQKEIKTIYFSTRCDTCCYLYFIKDGKYLYFNLTDTVNLKLKEWKKISKSP